MQTLATASTLQDLKVLSLNLAQCRAGPGRRFAALFTGGAVGRFLAHRMMTTAVAGLAVWAVWVALA